MTREERKGIYIPKKIHTELEAEKKRTFIPIVKLLEKAWELYKKYNKQ